MKYSIIATKRFEKDFKRLGVEQRRRVDRAIRDMGQNPYAGKRLKGELAGKWSLKIGMASSTSLLNPSLEQAYRVYGQGYLWRIRGTEVKTVQEAYVEAVEEGPLLLMEL